MSAEIFLLHGVDLNLGARKREMQRCLGALPHNVERDCRAHVAAHPIDGLFDVVLIDRHVVHGDHHVAWQNSCARRRRPVERCDHRDFAVVDADVEADAGVVPRRADPNLFVLRRAQVARMLVELLDDPTDRAVDEALVIDSVDVLATYAVEDFVE